MWLLTPRLRHSSSLCAPPLKDLKALQGSLGTSPPLFVPSSTGPSHDVMGFFWRGLNWPTIISHSFQNSLHWKKYFSVAHLVIHIPVGSWTSQSKHNVVSHYRAFTPFFFCFDFFPPEYVSSLLFFCQLWETMAPFICLTCELCPTPQTSVFTQRAAHQLANWRVMGIMVATFSCYFLGKITLRSQDRYMWQSYIDALETEPLT